MFLLQISPPFGLSWAPADSVPEMRLNSSTGVTHSPVYLAHILPKSASNGSRWSALACARPLTADVEKHFVLKGIWRCSQVLGAMLSFIKWGSLQSSPLLPLSGAAPMAEHRQLGCLPRSSLTFGNSWPWEPHIYTWSCKPMWPNAHGHGGPFLVICVACLGSALCDSLGLSASETLHLEREGWTIARTCFGLGWF